MPTKADLKPLGELDPAEAEAWHAFQASDPALASPYFSLAWCRAVEAARPGIEVLCFRENGVPTGFLPLRRALMGFARPPGGPIDDLHGVIASPDTALDLAGAMRAAGIGGYGFAAVPYAQCRHGLNGHTASGNQVIDLSRGLDAYHHQRAQVSRSFKRLRAKARRLLDTPGVEVRHDIRDAAAFERMTELKRAAMAEAGHFDIFTLAWVRRVLEAVAASEEVGARGVVSTLHIDGALAAMAFNMRSQSVLHYWFPAYEPALADRQAGNALLFSLVEWAGGEGIGEIHLGLGDDQYKLMMASHAAPVRIGEAAFAGPARLLCGLAVRMRQMEQRGGPALPARLVRKLDRIALTGHLGA